MKKLTLLLFLFCSTMAIAQTWDGGGDGTSWDDAMNWDNDLVPEAGDIVTIGMDVTINGTAPNNPSRVVITSNRTVTFALNLNIGDGTIAQHALKVQGNATLNLGSGAGETFTINTATNRDAVQQNATGSPANVFVAASSTLNITQARDGISFTGTGINVFTNNGEVNISGVVEDGILLSSGQFINNGTLDIEGANQDAIDNEANFTNTGTVTINDANSIGINNRSTGTLDNSGTITITNTGATTTDGINSEGTINNTTNGTITCTKMDDDGVELTGGMFTNDGTLNVTVEDAGGTNNNGLAVGTSSAAATFINTSNNSVNADGGIGGDGRAIFIFEMGTLTNTGTMTLTGGNTNARMYSRGITTNDNGGTIDMTDGRINVNQGTFTNDGLIVSTRTSPSVFNTATAINNGFYKYDASVNSFASGSGTNTDNGINLNDATETTIEAMGLCTVDIAETEYTYYNDGNVVGSTDATGSLTIPMDGVISDPAILTLNEYPNIIVLTITDICAESILPIELANFDIKKERGKVIAKWETLSEINSDYIALERSNNGDKWNPVNRVKAQGNSSSIVEYQIIDENPNSGSNYYRLKLVDLDGYTEYSDIRTIQIGKDRVNELNVFPSNLSIGQNLSIDLSGFTDESLVITAQNLSGQTFNFGAFLGGHVISIDTQNLTSGMYVIIVQNNDQILTQKIIIN